MPKKIEVIGGRSWSAGTYHLTNRTVEKFPDRPLYKNEGGDDHIFFLELPLGIGWRVGPKSAFMGSFPTGDFWYKSKLVHFSPSSIYSWPISHILEHDFFCLGHLGCAGSKGKKWI